MGQDQVSGGVSVLCWLAAPIAMFYGNLQNSVIRSKSVLKSSIYPPNVAINVERDSYTNGKKRMSGRSKHPLLG